MSVKEENTEMLASKRYCQYDDVFKHISSFGLYQKILYFGCCMLNVLLGPQGGLLVFGVGTPVFQCATENVTCPTGKCCDNCTSYTFINENQYTTAVTEWNLICDRAHIAATIQSCFFAGMLVGSVVGGVVSDTFGRRRCLFVNCAILVVSTMSISFVDCVSFLCLLCFVSGLTGASFMLASYVFCIELLGPAYRTMGGQVNNMFWPLGYLLAAFLSYFIPDWRNLYLVTSLLPALLFLTWRVFPESARWLIAHNRLDEAHAVLMKFGGKDGGPVDPAALKEVIKDIRRDQKEREHHTKQYTVLDLIKTPKLRKRTFILAYCWFVVALVYFGIFLYVTNLAGSLYLNYSFMTSIYIPQLFICWFIMQKFGRRFPFCIYMLATGVVFLLILAVSHDYPIGATVLAIVGKTFISTEFSNVYLYTTELYPTLIRNSAMGVGSMSARVGGILAPYIVMTSQLPGLSLTLPVTIFGVNALIAGILSLWLPETLYSTLPQTIEEAEAVEEDYSLPCRARHRKREQIEALEINVRTDEEDAKA